MKDKVIQIIVRANGDMIYALTESGNLYLLERDNQGRLSWELQLESPKLKGGADHDRKS